VSLQQHSHRAALAAATVQCGLSAGAGALLIEMSPRCKCHVSSDSSQHVFTD